MRTVRWELLFADLEAQLATERASQARAEVAELVRAEHAATHLASRLRASLGRTLGVRVGDLPGEPDAAVAGDLVDAGTEWLLLAQAPARQVLVPLVAVQAVTGLAPHVAPAPGAVRARLGITHALRALARDRVEARVSTAARTVVGRLDRVGADYVDVTPASGPGWTVPLAALRVVRSW